MDPDTILHYEVHLSHPGDSKVSNHDFGESRVSVGPALLGIRASMDVRIPSIVDIKCS